MLKVTVLGTGASSGVPMIGCQCAVCTSANPKNKRSRVSVLVESDTTKILIDTPPEIRTQCITHAITTIDAVIYTHSHADHLHGIDDLRSFNHLKGHALPIYSDAETLTQIEARFPYIFLPPQPINGVWFRPSLHSIAIKPPERFTIGDIEIQTFWQTHGKAQTLGLIFNGKIGYSTDTNGLSEEALTLLQGLDCWIVDCMRYEEAPTHAHLAMTLEWIAHVKPKIAYLTHMNHDFDFDILASELPANVMPAYDGLTIHL